MNELFCGILRENKDLGQGTTKSKDPITEDDFAKPNTYFEARMRFKPDAESLQYMLLFYIIYYTGRRGCENLCRMKKIDLLLVKILMGDVSTIKQWMNVTKPTMRKTQVRPIKQQSMKYQVNCLHFSANITKVYLKLTKLTKEQHSEAIISTQQ